MKIYAIHWTYLSIKHISRHNITPEEVEEVCFDDAPLVERGKGTEIYYVLGKTLAGRYLFIVCRNLGKGRMKIITARNMTDAERKRYVRRR